jgi:hypothetical protein
MLCVSFQCIAVLSAAAIEKLNPDIILTANLRRLSPSAWLFTPSKATIRE